MSSVEIWLIYRGYSALSNSFKSKCAAISQDMSSRMLNTFAWYRFYLHDLTAIKTWVSNCIHSFCGVITHTLTLMSVWLKRL